MADLGPESDFKQWRRNHDFKMQLWIHPRDNQSRAAKEREKLLQTGPL
jgi:hypothetical protein